MCILPKRFKKARRNQFGQSVHVGYAVKRVSRDAPITAFKVMRLCKRFYYPPCYSSRLPGIPKENIIGHILWQVPHSLALINGDHGAYYPAVYHAYKTLNGLLDDFALEDDDKVFEVQLSDTVVTGSDQQIGGSRLTFIKEIDIDNL